MATPLRPPTEFDPNKIHIHGFNVQLKFNGPFEQLSILAQRARDLRLEVELTAEPGGTPNLVVRTYDEFDDTWTAQKALLAFNQLLNSPEATS